MYACSSNNTLYSDEVNSGKSDFSLEKIHWFFVGFFFGVGAVISLVFVHWSSVADQETSERGGGKNQEI